MGTRQVVVGCEEHILTELVLSGNEASLVPGA